MGTTDTGEWRKMKSAPKDGTRIIVVIRATEQGPSAVDVVRWDKPRRAGEACWVSIDSSLDCAIMYDDWEVANWMPLPSTLPLVRTPDLASKLPPIPLDQEAGGSGI